MPDPQFKIATNYTPQGDQPKAIIDTLNAFKTDRKDHVLLGVTGSGKTFTMAHVIEKLGRPTLIIAPNKTLAAQLFTEMKDLFPTNAVEFFISYYDYFQPEAYVPTSDTYIAKDSSINEDIDKMRHAATQSLFERKDVIIVASVSCIYGLGSPEAYSNLVFSIEKGQEIARDKFLRNLIDIQYTRNDMSLTRGCFRVRGDTVDILPANKHDEAVRVEFFGDEIDEIQITDAISGKPLRNLDRISLYPNSHYVTDRGDTHKIVQEILEDLGVRLRELKAQNKLVEYQRLEQRTMHDIEAFEHLGYCPGVENYSRYLTGLPPGHPPPCLLDYFPKDFLVIIDESHITNSQIGAMYKGDRARKENLVNYGFRLPSALDNRPLNFDEFRQRTAKTLHVSATPGAFELQACGGSISEQVIRPTGLIDPEIEVRPAKTQVDDLYTELKKAIEKKGRVLITTLTKKMAEDLTQYYMEMGLKIRYLHSDIDSLERVEILNGLRRGDFDVLVGINLLREGLDLPEVRLVAVMDADREGFLRSHRSLIQITGRAARNKEGRVIFYADKYTDSMNKCIEETNRRRKIQTAYNEKHGITPQSIIKNLPPDIRKLYGIEDEIEDSKSLQLFSLESLGIKTVKDLDKLIKKKAKEMEKKAGELEFEDAANLRDEIASMKQLMYQFGDDGAPIGKMNFDS